METSRSDHEPQLAPRAGLDKPGGPKLSPAAPTVTLRGVGPKLAERLAAAGLRTVGELLTFFPRRHDEVDEVRGPDDASIGRLVRMQGRVRKTTRGWLGGGRSIVTVEFTSVDGGAFRVSFFNQPWLEKSYAVGVERWLEGRLGKKGKQFVLEQPRVLSKDHAPAGPIVVRYREIEGISEQRLRALIQQALARMSFDERIVEPLPEALGAPLANPEAAFRAMHEPRSAAEHERAREHFALLEAVQLFREVELRRRARARLRGPGVRIAADHEACMRKILPFDWTSDQARAVRLVRRGLTGSAPFGCLLHGDVGTGKTAVAVDAVVATVASGHQAALLAPTELLAEQHDEVITGWVERAGIRVVLLVGSLPPAVRRERVAAIARGQVDLVIGTHALLSGELRFARLGLVIVDEQHRFGVEQRTELVAKGRAPHVIVMSATPIPRTLTLSLFGDLDAIVLRERPPGRRMPPAVFVPRERWTRVLAAIERHVRRGGKAYVVCPKIGEDESKGGAFRMFAELSRRFPCGLVHGRQPAAERRAVTDSFRAGEHRVLVGTTVLEVGVDVTDATLMVVAGAERLGLASLHQLRGRVGRGTRRGLCILTGTANARTDAVCRTADGFTLAEADLRLRGAGELLGTRQSGTWDFRALDPLADFDLLRRARDAVRQEA